MVILLRCSSTFERNIIIGIAVLCISIANKPAPTVGRLEWLCWTESHFSVEVNRLIA